MTAKNPTEIKTTSASAPQFETGAITLNGPRHLGCKFAVLYFGGMKQFLNGGSALALGNSVSLHTITGLVSEIEGTGDGGYVATVVENRVVAPGSGDTRRVVGYLKFGPVECAVPVFVGPVQHERELVLEARAAIAAADEAERKKRNALSMLNPAERSSVTGAA